MIIIMSSFTVLILCAVVFFLYSIIVILCVSSFITVVIITVFNFLACAVCLWRINVFIIIGRFNVAAFNVAAKTANYF